MYKGHINYKELLKESSTQTDSVIIVEETKSDSFTEEENDKKKDKVDGSCLKD